MNLSNNHRLNVAAAGRGRDTGYSFAFSRFIFTGAYARQVLVVCGINIIVACSVRLINLDGAILARHRRHDDSGRLSVRPSWPSTTVCRRG